MEVKQFNFQMKGLVWWTSDPGDQINVVELIDVTRSQ